MSFSKKLQFLKWGYFILRFFVIVYIFIGILCYFFLNKLMFHPPAVQNTSVFREMFFAESPIGPIALLHLKAENADKTILYSHGNAEDVSNLTWAFSYFLKERLSVCAYDYPGYGISPGIPTEKNVYAAAETAYKYLTEKCKIEPQNIIIYGRSIGSGASWYLAEKYPVGALIIECGFTSITRVVTQIKLFPFDAFPNIKRVSNVNCPVLFFHGKQDQIVPFNHGKTMYMLANEPKYKLWIPHCGHNDIIHSAEKCYIETLHSFLDTLRKKTP